MKCIMADVERKRRDGLETVNIDMKQYGMVLTLIAVFLFFTPNADRREIYRQPTSTT